MFQKTLSFATATELEAAMPSLQRGQWINLDGSKGRVVGQGASTWVAWGAAARKPALFRKISDGFKASRHGYNPVAVNQAIEASNRAGRRISGREARAIHALLAGRH